MKVVRWDEESQRFSSEKMQKVGLFSSPLFFLDLYCLEPGQRQKPHAHEGSEKIYLVTQGQGRFQVGSQQQHLGAGEAVMASSGELHGILNDSDARLVVLTLMVPPPV